MDHIQATERSRSDSHAAAPARIRYVLRCIRMVPGSGFVVPGSPTSSPPDTLIIWTRNSELGTRNQMSLAPLIFQKVEEQIERAEHLIALIPPDKIEWRPAPDMVRICDLLGHLLECLAGFCAAFYALDKDSLAHF